MRREYPEAKPIRVLVIAPSLRITGGHSVQADRLLRSFRACPDFELRLYPIDRNLPGWLRRIPLVRTAANAALYYAGLLPALRRCDVVHAFTAAFWGYTLWIIPALWLGQRLGRKVMVNYHDGRARQHLRDWPSALRTLRLADAIATPSRYLAEVFAEHGLAARVVPNSIDLAAFPYRERTAPRPLFLTNRGLEPLYNVECTLRAFRLIQDRYPDARFVVANDGPLRRELEELARRLELRRITFTGAVSQQRMAELYDTADIYLMSPLIDNMPLTLLECFASGLPAVTSNSGGIPYVAEDGRNALVAARCEPEDLAAACFRQLEEPGLSLRLTRQARADCEARYGAEAVRDQWRSLYRELARG